MQPIITSSTPLIYYSLSNKYEAILFHDITAPKGCCQYKYILQVSEKNSQKPICWVTSEVAFTLPNFPSPGSHVLGAFVKGSHRNYGFNDKWERLDDFLPKALELAKNLIGDEEVKTMDWVIEKDYRAASK